MHALIRVAIRILVVVALVLMARSTVHWLRVRPEPPAKLMAVSFPALRGGPDEIDLHDLLEPIRLKHKVPALAAVVIKDGRIVARGVCGARRAGGTEAVTIDDRFHMGSETKAMTATLIAELVEDGTLSWTTTVGDVFAERFKGMDAGWKAVTLADLMHHRGGVPSNLDAGGLWARLRERKGSPTDQRLELVEGIVTQPPLSKPGSMFLYANAGYAIAGAMAEVKTGKAWEELITERVFKPLGITSAGFGAPGMAGTVDQPRGHAADGQAVEPGPNADNPPAIAPAGTVHLSLPDWAKFVTVQVRGDASNPARETRLVSPASFDAMHTPEGNYAMGWLVTTRAWGKGDRPGDTGRVLNHAGSNTLWYAVAWLAPERDAAVLVATNQGGKDAEQATDAAAWALVKKFVAR